MSNPEVPGDDVTASTPPPRTSGLAIASVIVSLSGLLGFGCGFLGIAAPIGLVLGIIARKRIKQSLTLSDERVAVAGIIAGTVVTIMMGVFWMIYLSFYGLPLPRG